MKQVLQSYRSGELWLAEVPAPAVKPGQVLVRVSNSVISPGTEGMLINLAQKSLLAKARARPDLVKKVISKIRSEGLSAALSKVFAKLDTPIPLGYSAAGTVVAVGEGVEGVAVGDRVACGGAGYANHAEFISVPENLCVHVPETVSDEDAAFATIGSIAMQGVRQADVRIGENVAVIGLGLLGLLSVQILKAAGCRVLGFDPDNERCSIAAKLGADRAVCAELTAAADAFTAGRGLDRVIVAAGTKSNDPIEQSAEIARMKGRVVVVGMVGMNIPRDPFYKKELELRLSMSYGPGRYDEDYEERGHDYPYGYVRWTEQRNMESVLDLVSSGGITPDQFITHRFALEDALKAYEMLGDASSDTLGIMLDYDDEVEAGRSVSVSSGAAVGKVRIGMIGAGGFAKGVLLPEFKKISDVELVAVCTSRGESASETAKKFGFSEATTDADAVIGSDDVNTIVIATRHDSHADLVCGALRAGKHVFVEKPLCITPTELETIIGVYQSQVTNQQSPILMVGFNRSSSAHAIDTRAVFADLDGPLAIVYRVNAGELPADHWTRNQDEGGGRIVGEVCHFIDTCSFICGAPVSRVFADRLSATSGRAGDEDSCVITLHHKNGSVSSIQYVANGSGALAKERIEIHGAGVSAVIDDFANTQFYGTRATGPVGKDKGIPSEVRAFVTAVADGGPSSIPFESIVNTTRTSFAILESLRTGTAVSL